jgi:hypothetical protein
MNRAWAPSAAGKVSGQAEKFPPCDHHFVGYKFGSLN